MAEVQVLSASFTEETMEDMCGKFRMNEAELDQMKIAINDHAALKAAMEQREVGGGRGTCRVGRVRTVGCS